jgi:excisionase family DNA binding protein
VPRSTTSKAIEPRNREERRHPERLLTAAEFGEATNTSERFARRLIDEKRIRFVKLGKFVRIPESAVAEFISAGTVEAVQ